MSFIQETSKGSKFLQKESTPADRSLVNSVQFYEVQVGSDGASSNTIFTLSKAYVVGTYTLLVFVNGQLSEKVSSASDATEYEETDSYTVTFGASLQDVDVVEFYVVGSYKIGQSDFDTLMSSYQTAFGGLADFKNKIINSDFNISQRGTSFAAVPHTTYTLDRFIYYKNGTMVHTITRDTDVPTQTQSGHKSNYSMKVDCTTADAVIDAGNFCEISQPIEGYNFTPLVGKTCILSFWVKATKTGTYSFALTNSGNDNSYVSEYTINSSDTWEKKEITITFDYTSGTWDYTDGAGLRACWILAMGSTHTTSTFDQWLGSYKLASTNQVNACDNVANNFWLSQVQLEVASEATPFEGLPIQKEIELCQRYFEKSFALDTTPADGVNGLLRSSTAINATTMYVCIPFVSRKRAIPTMTFYNDPAGGAANKWGYYDNVAWNAAASTSLSRGTTMGATISMSGAAFTANESILVVGNWVADAEL